MMEKRCIWVSLDSGNNFFDDFDGCGVFEIADRLRTAASNAPAEFRNFVILDIDHYSDEYFCNSSWEIGYRRMETDEEYNARLAKESRDDAMQALAEHERERALYEQLKKKFEP